MTSDSAAGIEPYIRWSFIDTFAIPALQTGKSNQADVDNAKRDRVRTAIFLTVVSPEFQVQR
jgi:hypothetical protein